jgi:RNA polymerase sigma-70 factor (ECF subfamily)
MTESQSALHTRPSLLLRVRDPADVEAWNIFYTLYAPLVCKRCRAKGLQDADAADVCQKVFVKLLGRLRSFTYEPGKGQFRDYLGVVVTNEIHRFFRTGANASQTQVDGDERLTRLPAPEDTQWIEEFMRHVFPFALERIRPHFAETTWQVFEERWLNNRPAAEVAAELDVPVATVFYAQSRVLARLREAIRELTDDVPIPES